MLAWLYDLLEFGETDILNYKGKSLDFLYPKLCFFLKQLLSDVLSLIPMLSI